MRVIIICLALILIAASTTGALFGGFQLIMYPDGSTVKFPLELLKHTPFKNFRIPGILLFISTGLFGLWTIFFTIFQQPYHEKYIIAAGLILTIWILTVMALIPYDGKFQYLVLSIGIAQVLCGLSLDKNFKMPSKKPTKTR